MTTKPMKEAELREAATCANCGKKIGQSPLPIFYRLTIARHIVDFEAVKRQNGLAELIGGNGFVALAMGPDEDMTKPLMDTDTITICEKCSTELICVAQLAYLVNQKSGNNGKINNSTDALSER